MPQHQKSNSDHAGRRETPSNSPAAWAWLTRARPHTWQLKLAGAAAIVALVFISYWPAKSGDFLLDDDNLLYGSPQIMASDGLYRFWFTTEPEDYWPVTNSSLWLEWRLWGKWPDGYRITNLALHCGSALLIWAILRRLSIPGAYLAAVLFAVHPVNVASVAWISQRKNTLAPLFCLGSILSYLRIDGGKTRRAPIGLVLVEPAGVFIVDAQ